MSARRQDPALPAANHPLGQRGERSMTTESRELESAGAVVLAGPPEDRRVAVLHRRSPDEWRLPKGKLEPGETPVQAAEREVLEEIGLEVAVGAEVGQTRYTYRSPRGRAVEKTVAFYLAVLPEPRPLQPEAGPFDEARWMTLAEALAALTWENERQVVQKAVEMP